MYYFVVALVVVTVVLSYNVVVSTADSHLGTGGEVDRMNHIWYEFQEILTSAPELRYIERAKSLLTEFSGDNSEYLDLSVNGKPLLHQLMNIYWVSKDMKMKNALVDMMLTAIELGASVDRQVNGEPNLLTKAFMTKELQVAMHIVRTSNEDIASDAQRLWDLYNMNCNPTPLTKLLLHVHTRAHAVSKSNATQVSVTLRSLLSSAFLDGQSPVIKIRDLEALSTHYENLVSKLSSTNEDEMDITSNIPAGKGDVYLHEVIESLGDVVNAVHHAILYHQHSTPLTVATTLVSLTAFCTHLDVI
jgi:hypothetical protein